MPLAGLPGKPGKPVVMVNPGSIQAVIGWINGDSGNVPFEKFEIQSKANGKLTCCREISWLRPVTDYSLFFIVNRLPFPILFNFKQRVRSGENYACPRYHP